MTTTDHRSGDLVSGRTVLPTRASGWVALAAAAIGLGSWVVLPIITSVFGDTYPVTDSYVMPLIGVALVAIAAVVNVLVLWLGRQRCVLCIVATVLTVCAAGMFGFITIGEWLGGA